MQEREQEMHTSEVQQATSTRSAGSQDVIKLASPSDAACILVVEI